MMKYLYSSIFFIIFIYAITNVIEFNYTQETENIDMSDGEISQIVIDVDNANVSLSTTVDKDIKVEHIYSESKEPTSQMYTYQEGDTLYINEYPYNNKNFIIKKETLNIYIPEEYEFGQLNVLTEGGEVNVDSVTTDKLNINSQTGNVNIANANVDSLEIEGVQFGINISNTVSKTLTTSMTNALLNINNSIINEAQVANEGPSTVNITKLVTNNFKVNGKQTDVNLMLSSSLDYKFITDKSLANQKLTSVDGGYIYTENNLDKVNVYDLSDTGAISTKFEENPETETKSEDE